MWDLFEIAATCVQMLIFTHFFYCFFGPRCSGRLDKAGFLCCWLATVLCVVAGNYLQGFGSIEVFGVPVLQLLYVGIFLAGKMRVKVLILILVTVMTAGLSVGIFWLSELLLGKDINILNQQPGAWRAAYIICVNLIFFYVTRLILSFKNRDWLIHTKESGLLLAFPFVTLVLLFIMEKLVRLPGTYTVGDSAGMLIAFGLLGCNFIIYYLFMRISKANEERITLFYLQKQYETQQENMQKVLQAEKEARQIRHDISNILTGVLGYLDKEEYARAKEYILKIKKEQLASIKVDAVSNNTAFNYIIAEKQKICDEEKIVFSYSVLVNEWFISDVDICILLGNLLDNAIEASRGNDRKEIELYIMKNQGELEIKVENRIEVPVLVENTGPKTTKKDKKNHGFGMGSVENIVEKYQGLMDIYEKNERFCVSVILYSGK